VLTTDKHQHRLTTPSTMWTGLNKLTDVMSVYSVHPLHNKRAVSEVCLRLFGLLFIFFGIVRINCYSDMLTCGFVGLPYQLLGGATKYRKQ